MWFKLSNGTSLWMRRLALYFSLYFLIIGSHLFFKKFDWWYTDVDSARYMLSALIQSEAAIVALVITLSLVVVQLAASSYSPRVIEVFRKTPDFWILIGIYGFAIFFGLGVLKLIEKANTQENNLSNLEGHISFAYYFGVFAFVVLGPYVWNILNLLQPSSVINMLVEKITKDNIIFFLKNEKEKSSDIDPIQPIIDIVRSSLMKNDYETVRYGIIAIGERTKYLIKNESFLEDDKIKIFNHVFSHFSKVGLLAISKKDEYSTVEIINNLSENGKIVIHEFRLNQICNEIK